MCGTWVPISCDIRRQVGTFKIYYMYRSEHYIIIINNNEGALFCDYGFVKNVRYIL